MNIELVLNDKVIFVPDELTIRVFQRLQKDPEFFDKNPNALMATFLDISLHELKDLPNEHVKFVSDYVASKLTKPQENELMLTFEFNGVEYGLENNWGSMSFGAWVDFEVFSQDPINNIHRIMSIMYRPILSKDNKDPKKYTIEPYKSEQIEERANLFLDLPVRSWVGSAGFFFQIVELYITNIKSSLELKNKVNERVMKGWKILPKFLRKRLRLGSILLSYTHSQKKTLPK
jgi:hypothetical protein